MPRSIVYIWASLLLFVIALYVALHIFAVRSFVELERASTGRNVSRLLRAIADRRAYINSKASDWAAWDDAYQFVQDRNSRFIQSNIVLSAFTGIDLNLIAYTDNSGHIVYARWYSRADHALVPLPAKVLEAVEGCRLLNSHKDVRSSISGILMIGQKPLLIASRPVITSNEQGPIRGSLIFGRLLDSGEVRSFSRLIGVAADIVPLNNGHLPADFMLARKRIWRSGQAVVVPINRRIMAGYATIDDIYGKPSLIARVEIPRSIYNRALVVTNYTMAAFVILSLVFGLLDSLLILRTVRKEREFDQKTHEFYRQTITAATGGKLMVVDMEEIDLLCRSVIAKWEVTNPSDIPEIRTGVQDAAVSAGIDQDRAWKFGTGVGEAVTNAIKHASGGSACLCRQGEGLLFIMSDHGPGIPALSLPDVALRRGYSTAGTLGMGYKIMISFMDRVYLATGPKGTTVAIEMKLNPTDGLGETGG